MSRTGNNRSPEADAWIKALLTWFSLNSRAMPWRSNPEPYRVWISEIMLQQTQVISVIPYFNRFISRFPDTAALAAAPLQEVLKAWEGLGYYTRARNLHRAAIHVIEQRSGRIPETFDDLLTLPGIGRYTAAAIASIAFGEPVPVVDGNVLRVFTRFLNWDDNISLPATRDRVFDFLKTPIALSGNPSHFNQGIMELGALVCTPANPKCPDCPLHPSCGARLKGRTAELPVKTKKAPVRHEVIGVGLVFDSRGRLLIARRKADGLLGGLWEFPGGKRQGRESLRATTVREVREETGLLVEAGRALPPVNHAYSHFTVTLHPFICKRLAGRARAIGSDEIRWVTPAQLQDYPFPAANRKIETVLRSL
jgi:A/G-specific adenine glycosylase